jgi:hypothetical protein
MKSRLIAIAILFLSCLGLAHAADLAGTWAANFDSQIGPQKYTYEFKSEDNKFTGKATYVHSMGKGSVELKNIALKGDDISFSETVAFDGNELIITYTGKIAGDELKLTRKVGDFATEELVAKRVKDTEAKPAATK